MVKKVFLLTVMLFAAAGLRAQKQQVMLDKVVAVVGSSSILYSEVDEYARNMVAQRLAEGYTTDRDPHNEALEALLTQKLLYNQALIDSVDISAADIQTRVEEQLQNMIDEEGSIPKLEAKHHMPIFNLREILRQRYEEQAYASSMQAEVVNKVTIIPGEVERYYKHIDKDSLPLIADQYVYAQITRFPRTMTEAKQRTRARYHRTGQVREPGPHVFAGPRYGHARRRDGAHAAGQPRPGLCRRAGRAQAGPDIGGGRDPVRLPHHPVP